jgi:PAS domain S-box-containing protein
MWAKLQYLGIVIIPYMWFVLSLQYTRQHDIKQILPRWVLWCISIVPLVTLILTFTNESHGLLWRDIQWGRMGDQETAVFLKGVWYWVNVSYSYALLFAGAVLFTSHIIQNWQDQKEQAIFLSVMILAPLIGNILYITGISPFPHLDLTPFGFVLGGIALILGVYRFHIFNIVPIARDILVESISDAVIVLDCEGRIIDLNIAASRITRSERSKTIGKAGVDLFPMIPGIDSCTDSPISLQSELLLNKNILHPEEKNTNVNKGNSQFYDVTINPIFTRRNRHVGHLVILRDVTPHVKMQAALADQQKELEYVVNQRTTA